MSETGSLYSYIAVPGNGATRVIRQTIAKFGAPYFSYGFSGSVKEDVLHHIQGAASADTNIHLLFLADRLYTNGSYELQSVGEEIAKIAKELFPPIAICWIRENAAEVEDTYSLPFSGFDEYDVRQIMIRVVQDFGQDL